MALKSFPATSEAQMITKSKLLWLLAAMLMAIGCRRSGPPTYPVSGKVTYNGAPVADGSIILMPLDKGLSPDAGKISSGRFAFAAKAGTKKVEIRASREVGQVIREMGVKARQSYIPNKYNVETTLTAEVVSRGKNEFTFDLKGPP